MGGCCVSHGDTRSHSHAAAGNAKGREADSQIALDGGTAPLMNRLPSNEVPTSGAAAAASAPSGLASNEGAQLAQAAAEQRDRTAIAQRKRLLKDSLHTLRLEQQLLASIAKQTQVSAYA